MTDASVTRAPPTASPCEAAATVRADPSISPPLINWFMIACTPPEKYTSSM